MDGQRIAHLSLWSTYRRSSTFGSVESYLYRSNVQCRKKSREARDTGSSHGDLERKEARGGQTPAGTRLFFLVLLRRCFGFCNKSRRRLGLETHGSSFGDGCRLVLGTGGDPLFIATAAIDRERTIERCCCCSKPSSHVSLPCFALLPVK